MSEDLSKKIVNEFGPEFCTPLSMIFRDIMNSARTGPVKWPENWKEEVGIPLKKVDDPKNEDELRVIS